ncbi:MAG TPA: pyridoxal 5'-phosphate synthase, partial [Chitinophagales bacterium]|nr:pyridoxal 5'-phosphate synthase [Chitinophagales bacterium]
MNPVDIFNEWYVEQLTLSKASVPSAVCLSTIGLDGFPNARFVALKSIVGGAFAITGPVQSLKGLEINKTNKVALTFWWTETDRQVRVQGIASPLPGALADLYFSQREREAQLVSVISRQGKRLGDTGALKQKLSEARAQLAEHEVKRPDGWSGFLVEPIRIEFMAFKPSRLHERTLFERKNGSWERSLLQ